MIYHVLNLMTDIVNNAAMCEKTIATPYITNIANNYSFVENNCIIPKYLCFFNSNRQKIYHSRIVWPNEA